jgi:transposase
MERRIERVDNIPLIIHWLLNMRLDEIIDGIYASRKNWEGLSYGQLSIFFLTYVIHSLTHRLSGMESWFVEHKAVLEHSTGWKLNDKDATDDRLGIIMSALGNSEQTSCEFQQQMGQHLIQAYELPTKIARYDTTSFNVYHDPQNSKCGLLNFGYSKDHRPDLLQFKQGLGTLDPAGVPIFTETMAGNEADDGHYVEAWRRMVQTVGHSIFLYIADCKAASLENRGIIDKENGRYLFPLPMTGDTSEILKQLVFNPPEEPQEINLEEKAEKDKEKQTVGIGFVVEKQMELMLSDEDTQKWLERWMVTRSNSHAKRQQKGFHERMGKAEKQLNSLKPKKEENSASFQARAEKILEARKVKDYIFLKVEKSVERKKRYKGKGRPRPNTPFEIVEIQKLKLAFKRNDKAIEEYLKLCGWRIFVTNAPTDELSLNQSTRYYRDEWLVERGFHRFKKGSLPALPLFLRLHTRIKGLMLLLTVALQALTLLEFVARQKLAETDETMSGLVPGNPKMKTARPTAERLLSQFKNLHLMIEDSTESINGYLLEELSALQQQILSLLKIPADVYALSFKKIKLKNTS